MKIQASVCSNSDQPLRGVGYARLMKAASFAANKHRLQRRKDVDASPYINHPLALAHILASEGQVDDVDVLVASLLHDTIEDTDTSQAEIEREFGTVIARIVAEVTDDKTQSKEYRKGSQILKAEEKSYAAKLVKLADKISNLRDIASTPPVGWSLERQEKYFHWAKDVVDRLRGVNAPLEEAFDRAYLDGLQIIRAAV